MKKILILTASFGNGHNSAAFNLKDAVKLVSKETKIEILDLIQICYGSQNHLVRKIFLNTVKHFPLFWGGMYFLLDRTPVLKKGIRHFKKLREALAHLIETCQPDAIVSTYPIYNYIIDEIYKEDQKKPFLQFTVITDSITVNSVWYGASSDYFFVPHQLSSNVLIQAGIPPHKILSFGFPISPRFQALVQNGVSPSPPKESKQVLYLLGATRKQKWRIIRELLKIPHLRLTIICEDPKLKLKIIEQTRSFSDRVQTLGWTDQIPELLTSSDLVITKAGGAIVQEAIAARCPILIDHVIPGQEEGNADLVRLLKIGAVAKNEAEIVELVRQILQGDQRVLSEWRQNLSRESRPNAALQIAEFILARCNPK